MKVALLLPDGVGVRNFLLGAFRGEARQRLSLEVFQNVPESLRALYQGPPGEAIGWHEYRIYRDTPKLFMLRNVLSYAHQHSIDTWGMSCLRDLPIRGRLKRRVAAWTARTLGRCASGQRSIRWLERRLAAEVARTPETAYFRRLFQETQPAVVLSSNQRPYGVLPAVLAARSLGIPTATCIFSWDNLTSKGRIAAPFDHFFVWSALMRDELRQFYPHVPAERIHIVGTPQFDHYANGSLLQSREQFFETIGADPSRPLICYSSGELSNSPEDQDHTALLLDLIRQGRIAGNPQVVLRPTPANDDSRFNEVRKRFPELIYAKPRWLPGREDDWSHMFPTPEDVAFLANLAHYTDVNVNVASTMTLDFAIHHRPVVNVAFDLADPPPFKYPLWEYYYQFEHYRPVVETGAALFSRSIDEFADHVNTYLANPTLHEENRRRLLDIELGVPIGRASRTMIDSLLAIANLASAGAPVSDPLRGGVVAQTVPEVARAAR